MQKRWIRIVLTLCLVCALMTQAAAAATVDALEELLGTDDLLQSDTLIAGDSLSDWAALLAGRSGRLTHREVYLEKLWDDVSARYAETGGLDAVKATEWHRIALTVLALGADPTCFGTDAQGKPIDLIADGTYNWHMTDSLGTQGLNGWIFALLTLDARDYTVPANARFQREEILGAILTAQEADGGFGLAAGVSDVDMTAMALQALAPYQAQCREAIDKALDYLSAAQTARGDFESWGTPGAESCAQVVIALCSLGIDPRTDARFVKAGGSALDGLLLYQTETGAFCHTMGDAANLLATEQAGLALCALERMDGGKGGIYDFSDMEIQNFEYGNAGQQNALWYGLGAAGAAAVICAAGLLLWKGKRRCTKKTKK